VVAARRALERKIYAEPAIDGKQELSSDSISARYEDAGLIGRAPAMIDLYKEIAYVAPSRSTALIIGESGTGKELVARAIHHISPRKDHPFVAVNCGALTETLLEAELFGHVRGAFTGAVSDRRGLWEEAEGGTLFLDEIGETSHAMQVKLLRALQEGEIRRVGASRAVRINARVVAATNRDLEREVKAGTFRADLFYRLGVVMLVVPPLRERRGDISLLAGRFLRAASDGAKHPLRFSDAALALLESYDWPGNVRELENAVEYAALRARGAEVTVEDLPLKVQSSDLRQSDSAALLSRTRLSHASLWSDELVSLEEIERRYLLHVLEAVEGNRTRAAEVLGIDRRTLYRMAERFGIRLSD
jgi:transcriptional regulator with GAF, ATPase, and Fis domain